LGMSVLGHGQTSRLHRRLVRRDELAEAASASSMGLVGGTSMGYAYARARDGVDIVQVRDVVLEEVQRVVTGGVTETELQRAKAQYERHWLHDLARIDSRADAFGEYATLYGDPELVNRRLDQIDAVTLEDVHTALRGTLDPQHRATLLYRKERS
ncbi:MAG TPA: insulinase family protein, partial [Microlunatus sp.]|nr:insulinase family protein [Microlunatus sp.]